ncbi:hypothetical protein MPER_01892, partial [Moniliophthora perniciosa FA553]
TQSGGTPGVGKPRGPSIPRIGSILGLKIPGRACDLPYHRSLKASIKLDKEKIEAEENFKDALSKLPRAPGTHAQSCRMGLFIRIADWFKSLPGIRYFAHTTVHKYHAERWEEYLSRQLLTANGFDEDFDEENVDVDLPKNPILEFIKAAKRVSRSNKKLIAFERGFIHNYGIKDREWYRHLGVAPGKWLGYGATTFPALSEAIAIDKDLTAAKYEVKRLVKLLDKLAKETTLETLDVLY